VVAGLTQHDLERLATAGLGATEAVGLNGPTSAPSAYLHCFTRDGVLRWLWADPDTVPPGVPPVTAGKKRGRE
jgi:hypothetical protein